MTPEELRKCKLECLSLCGGNIDQAKRMLEWVLQEERKPEKTLPRRLLAEEEYKPG